MRDSLDGKIFYEFNYETESDTLSIWDRASAGGGGFDITYGVLIVFFDYDHATPVGLTLTDAAGLLGPYLPIECIANVEPVQYHDRVGLENRIQCSQRYLMAGQFKARADSAPDA